MLYTSTYIHLAKVELMEPISILSLHIPEVGHIYRRNDVLCSDVLPCDTLNRLRGAYIRVDRIDLRQDDYAIICTVVQPARYAGELFVPLPSVFTTIYFDFIAKAW